MINYSSNIEVVVNKTLDKIKELQNNPDPLLRTIALTVMPELKHRVHVDGKDSDGNQIGVYSPGYMKLRTGAYKNSPRVSRGKNKGKVQDAGRYTKGTNTKVFGTVVEETSKAGFPRPDYHRGPDTKVILSLTRQMENDLNVVATENHGYGIGYLNPENFKKSQWCEETYKKPILSKLTSGEIELSQQTAEEFTADYLKN